MTHLLQPLADGVLFRDAEVFGRGRADVRVARGLIASIGSSVRTEAADQVVACAGAALLPGLHDHHCHLLAYAATAWSIRCGPPDVRNRADLGAALSIPTTGWVRGVGYSERVAGNLDRARLDDLRADLPVRVQHRSGALWVLNSRAIDLLGLDDVHRDGVERDAAGHPTGRLWRLDGWLRSVLGPSGQPDLTAVSRRLAEFGITGITDATPDLDESSLALLTSHSVAQHVTLLGRPAGSGPSKIVLADHSIPSPDSIVERIRKVRPRPVAMHCVTQVTLVLALTALREVGTVPGDRIEHAAIASPELIDLVSELGVAVVTQPSLPHLRGDDYLDGVSPDEREALWPFRSLLEAGVRVGCGSDAPYGDPDPWMAISAAATRRTVSGQPIGDRERVSAERALRGYLTHPRDPGGRTRELSVGTRADLVLLDRPLREALRAPSSDQVAATMIDGRFVYGRAEWASA